MEAAKKIASMWTEMAQLLRFTVSSETIAVLILLLNFLIVFRKECVLKERGFKEDIVDLAKSISKESQEVMRVAKSIAEACTDKIMKNVSHGKTNN